MNFLGKSLLSKSGEVLPSSLKNSGLFFLYFSASWCPPCRKFTPKLIDFYNLSKSSQKDLEIILVGLDETQEAHSEYFSKMPWLGLPYSEKSLIESLTTKYSIRTIPTLLMVSQSGELLYNDCRHRVETEPQEAYDNLVKILLKKSKENN